MSLPTNPLNRKEAYLNAIATGNTVDMPAKPITREEAYLDAIAKNGGGSGDGDMKKSVYDSDLAVANAGGIKAFVGEAVDEVESKSWSLGGGTSIANNTDLNDITTVGNYYATTQTAATLSHCPTTGGFKLKVLYDVRETAPTYIEQVFNPISSYDEYSRYKSGSAKWSDWHLTNCNLDEVREQNAANTSAIEVIENVTGAKNLNSYPYYESTKTDSGITYTVNNDGSVTVSGVPEAETSFVVHSKGYPNTNGCKLKTGSYILTGCPDGGSPTTYLVKLVGTDGEYGREYGSGLSFTVSNDEYISVEIIIKNGVNLSTPITFYPMIRPAGTDPTYVPYAMTNRELTEETSGVWDSINGVYTGRDLTVVFASEIANYSDEWAWIQARLNAHNVSGLRVGDYIPINIAANGGIAAETHKAEIAGINTYRRTGDSGHEVGYHIDWITRDCYSGTVKFNTTNINNGNASNSSPFLASNLKSWLDGTLYPLLETKVKNVIKAKRILAPYRYQSGATLTDDNSWSWQDFDKLWVPLESEIFDSLVWSTKGYGNGQAVQYPIFANSYKHRMKGAGPSTIRAHWWTASAHSGNSTYVVYVSYNGHSNNNGASSAYCVPVCFRTMED